MSLFVAALLVSVQAAATQSPSAQAPAVETEKKVKQKKICKSDDLVSGSRMARRLCLTEEEWAQRNSGMSQSARAGYSGKAEDH
ncbi:MAG TPA: hypothetical protein VIZ66_03610 [Sphingomicrobium sp.]